MNDEAWNTIQEQMILPKLFDEVSLLIQLKKTMQEELPDHYSPDYSVIHTSFWRYISLLKSHLLSISI